MKMIFSKQTVSRFNPQNQWRLLILHSRMPNLLANLRIPILNRRNRSRLNLCRINRKIPRIALTSSRFMLQTNHQKQFQLPPKLLSNQSQMMRVLQSRRIHLPNRMTKINLSKIKSRTPVLTKILRFMHRLHQLLQIY